MFCTLSLSLSHTHTLSLFSHFSPLIVILVVTNIIYLSILLLLSGVVTLVQAFFQISLATSYKDELSDGCEFVYTSDSLPSKGILSFVIMLCMVL